MRLLTNRPVCKTSICARHSFPCLILHYLGAWAHAGSWWFAAALTQSQLIPAPSHPLLYPRSSPLHPISAPGSSASPTPPTHGPARLIPRQFNRWFGLRSLLRHRDARSSSPRRAPPSGLLAPCSFVYWGVPQELGPTKWRRRLTGGQASRLNGACASH